jgi:hypothetical protein
VSVTLSEANWALASFFFVGIKAIREKANDCHPLYQHRSQQSPKMTHVNHFLKCNERGSNWRPEERHKSDESVLANQLYHHVSEQFSTPTGPAHRVQKCLVDLDKVSKDHNNFGGRIISEAFRGAGLQLKLL